MNLRPLWRRQAASATMNRMEPRIAGFTPSVAASIQKTMSGPNSASAKRMTGNNRDMVPLLAQAPGSPIAARIALIASGR